MDSCDISVCPDYSKQIKKEKENNYKLLLSLYKGNEFVINTIFHRLKHNDFEVKKILFSEGVYTIMIRNNFIKETQLFKIRKK